MIICDADVLTTQYRSTADTTHADRQKQDEKLKGILNQAKQSNDTTVGMIRDMWMTIQGQTATAVAKKIA
jgi:hypothetical protein